MDTVQRIYSQRNESTPDKPVLQLEIKTDQCRVLEHAIQSVLRMRGRKIEGDGAEWFTVSREEILSIYEFIKSHIYFSRTERPLVRVGKGMAWSRAQDEVRTFIERTQITSSTSRPKRSATTNRS